MENAPKILQHKITKNLSWVPKNFIYCVLPTTNTSCE